VVERKSFQAMFSSYDATAKLISSKLVKAEIIEMNGKLRKKVILQE